jgi:hypothetical protein
LGQNNKRASGNSFNSYANLSSDIDLMNGPADVMIQTEGNHEMDTKWAQGTLTVLGIDGDLVDFSY